MIRSNLVDINGDAVHASLGLPPALNVTTAKVGKLEIMVGNFLVLSHFFILISSSLSLV